MPYSNMSLALEKLGQRPEAIDRATAALVIFEQIESPDAEDCAGGNWWNGKDKKKTFYHQHVCSLTAVARPAAAWSGAHHSAGGPQADSRHPRRTC